MVWVVPRGHGVGRDIIAAICVVPVGVVGVVLEVIVIVVGFGVQQGSKFGSV